MNMLTLLFAAVLALVSPRTVTVTVTVTKPGGEPVAGVPLAVRDGLTNAFAITNDAGVAVVHRDVWPAQRWLAVMPMPRTALAGEEEAATAARRAQEVDRLAGYAFKRISRLDLSDNEDQYAVSVSADPARKVKLRLVRGGVPVRKAKVSTSDGCMVDYTSESGEVTLPGITRQATDLFVVDGFQGLRRPLAAGAVDLDLGDLELPTLNRSCAVDITVRQWSKPDKTVVPPSEFVLLVAADALNFVILPIDPVPANPVDARTESGPVAEKLPAGTWYVVARQFYGDPTQLRLFQRVATGSGLSNLAKVVAVEGQTATLDFDAADAEAAILAP